jgi:hypothetical protein
VTQQTQQVPAAQAVLAAQQVLVARRSSVYSFRYHLITLCSVFVALALGLLLGAAIASSDLAQSTTDDMVESMLSRYETLVDDNGRLKLQAEDNATLASTFIGPWSEQRLDGRTIVLLFGTGTTDTTLANTLADAIGYAGGSVVRVTGLKPDFGLDDEKLLAQLQELVAKESGEEYLTTLSRSLVREWSYVYTTSSAESSEADLAVPPHAYVYPPTIDVEGALPLSVPGGEGTGINAFDGGAEAGDGASNSSGVGSSSGSAEANAADDTDSTSSTGGTGGVAGIATGDTTTGELVPQTAFQELLFEQYPLTRTLLSKGVISISANYTTLEQHTDPAAPVNQQAALHVAEAWQLPYGVNGLVVGYAPGENGSAEQSQIGVQLALQMQEAGAQDKLVYPSWLRSSLPRASSGTVALPNYHVQLVQPSSTNTSMESIASTEGLSCATSPGTVSGRYTVLALLTGAQAGIYGENRPTEYHYPLLPQDPSGRAIFR